MFAHIKTFYNWVESLKGRRLIIALLVVFVLFLPIGLYIGYVTSRGLNSDEISSEIKKPMNPDATPSIEKKYYVGKVVYVNPELYPDEKISFMLLGSDGKELFLLKSNDQKLSIVQGLYVKVTGSVSKTQDGKHQILFVKEVKINNASD